jgi:hypothetical protein
MPNRAATRRSPIMITQAATIINKIGATWTLNRLSSVNLIRALLCRNRPVRMSGTVYCHKAC